MIKLTGAKPSVNIQKSLDDSYTVLLMRREKREKRFSKLQERFAKKQVRLNILKDKKDKASIIYKSKLEKQLGK